MLFCSSGDSYLLFTGAVMSVINNDKLQILKLKKKMEGKKQMYFFCDLLQSVL